MHTIGYYLIESFIEEKREVDGVLPSREYSSSEGSCFAQNEVLNLLEALTFALNEKAEWLELQGFAALQLIEQTLKKIMYLMEHHYLYNRRSGRDNYPETRAKIDFLRLHTDEFLNKLIIL